jgi:hypothetical protein
MFVNISEYYMFIHFLQWHNVIKHTYFIKIQKRRPALAVELEISEDGKQTRV